MEGKAAGKRISEILTVPLPVSLGSAAAPAPAGPLTITFSDVTFSYPGNERPALEGVNLELPAGTCTALIGRSGAGKSTLVNLLMRFLDPQRGDIRANGIALADLPVQTWRECIALVPQRPSLFTGSVLDNLRLARPDASDAEVAQAAELAGATEFIAQLPQGYATQLGERGARLSAGQMQRLAIARAFLKNAPLLVLDEPASSLDPESETLIRQALLKGAPLLILDEATANLDQTTEEALLQALDTLMHGRATLVITHRLLAMEQMDEIIVLDHGRVRERGTHGQLLAKGDLYCQLLAAQNSVLAFT
jgi:ATP-binding cassette subfamily C protein CydD